MYFHGVHGQPAIRFVFVSASVRHVQSEQGESLIGSLGCRIRPIRGRLRCDWNTHGDWMLTVAIILFDSSSSLACRASLPRGAPRRRGKRNPESARSFGYCSVEFRSVPGENWTGDLFFFTSAPVNNVSLSIGKVLDIWFGPAVELPRRTAFVA